MIYLILWELFKITHVLESHLRPADRAMHFFIDITAPENSYRLFVVFSFFCHNCVIADNPTIITMELVKTGVWV